MENLSKSSCTIPIFLEQSHINEYILSEASIHALSSAFENQGIHHLVFSSKQLSEQTLNKLCLLYAPLYNDKIYIYKTSMLLDDINLIESGSLIVSLNEDLNPSQITDNFSLPPLDLLAKETINIILISYTSNK